MSWSLFDQDGDSDISKRPQTRGRLPKRTGKGDPVPDELFQPVADALVKAGLI